MTVSPASATKAFGSVAALLDDAGIKSGMLVTLRGELLKSGDQVAMLADETNVISTSAASSIVDQDWAVRLRDTPALRAVLDQIAPPPNDGLIGSGIDDARRASVEITGIAHTEERMMLSPPLQEIEIEPIAAKLVPRPVADAGGFIDPFA